jgi:hypothetical protein
LREKLLGDMLLDADSNLHDRPSLLQHDERRNRLPTSILGRELDIEDWHEGSPTSVPEC